MLDGDGAEVQVGFVELASGSVLGDRVDAVLTRRQGEVEARKEETKKEGGPGVGRRHADEAKATLVVLQCEVEDHPSSGEHDATTGKKVTPKRLGEGTLPESNQRRGSVRTDRVGELEEVRRQQGDQRNGEVPVGRAVATDEHLGKRANGQEPRRRVLEERTGCRPRGNTGTRRDFRRNGRERLKSGKNGLVPFADPNGRRIVGTGR